MYRFVPLGLAPAPFELPGAAARFEFLRTVSENTGGFSVVDVNDPAKSVRRVFEETSAYYLIGYTPVDPPEPGGFRTVDVEVARPDVRVRTRRGYYTPEPDNERAELTSEERTLRDAVGGLLPVSAMPMRVQVAPFALPGRKEAAVVITTELRQPAPEELTEHTVELVISAYDHDRGRRRASTEQPVTVIMEPGREVRVEVHARLDLEPGRYEIRLARHNPEINLTGSVFQDVEVPDFTRDGVRLSGVVIATPRAGLLGPDRAAGRRPRDRAGDSDDGTGVFAGRPGDGLRPRLSGRPARAGGRGRYGVDPRRGWPPAARADRHPGGRRLRAGPPGRPANGPSAAGVPARRLPADDCDRGQPGCRGDAACAVQGSVEACSRPMGTR